MYGHRCQVLKGLLPIGSKVVQLAVFSCKDTFAIFTLSDIFEIDDVKYMNK